MFCVLLLSYVTWYILVIKAGIIYYIIAVSGMTRKKSILRFVNLCDYDEKFIVLCAPLRTFVVKDSINEILASKEA